MDRAGRFGAQSAAGWPDGCCLGQPVAIGGPGGGRGRGRCGRPAAAGTSPWHPLAERRDGGPAELAGILIEVLPDGRHVVGIGLNTNNTLADAPAELQSTAATLRDLGRRTYDQTAILIDLLQRLEREFVQLGSRPEAVAARADVLCLQRGQMLRLDWGKRSVAGLCRGIAADGAIRLETPTGTETFYSGSVSQDSINT